MVHFALGKFTEMKFLGQGVWDVLGLNTDEEITF